MTQSDMNTLDDKHAQSGSEGQDANTPGDMAEGWNGPVPTTDDQVLAWGKSLDEAMESIQNLRGEAYEAAQKFATALDALSRTALTTLVRQLRADPRGEELLFEAVDDAGIRLLFGIHGIIRLPDPEQGGRSRRNSVGLPVSHRTVSSLQSMVRGSDQGSAKHSPDETGPRA